jgi:hypothetical protein
MSVKYTVLSFLAFCMVLLLVFKNYEVWTQPIEAIPQREEPKRLERKAEIPVTKGGSEDTLLIQSYLAVAEKNIFSPARKDFPIQPGGGSRAVVRPQIVLYGVTIVGDYQAASLVNPGRPLRRGERELMTLKKGDQIGEYKLTKILSDRITLEAEEDSFEVLLYDPGMPKKRTEVKTEVKPATVTSTQLSPSAPAPGTTKPTPPPASADASRPSSPPQTVAPTPPAARTPTFPPPGVGRRGRPTYSPPSGTPTQETGGSQ